MIRAPVFSWFFLSSAVLFHVAIAPAPAPLSSGHPELPSAVPVLAARLEAQEHPSAQPDPAAREAVSKLRSPFCPGLMLEVCPTTNARALRDSIEAGARQGLSADSLVERVVAAYGEEYRAFPKRSGAGLWAWVMPPAALFLGLGLVVVVLRRLKGPGEVSDGSDLSDEDRERLNAALAEFDAMEEAEA